MFTFTLRLPPFNTCYKFTRYLGQYASLQSSISYDTQLYFGSYTILALTDQSVKCIWPGNHCYIRVREFNPRSRPRHAKYDTNGTSSLLL